MHEYRFGHDEVLEIRLALQMQIDDCTRIMTMFGPGESRDYMRAKIEILTKIITELI